MVNAAQKELKDEVERAIKSRDFDYFRNKTPLFMHDKIDAWEFAFSKAANETELKALIKDLKKESFVKVRKAQAYNRVQEEVKKLDNLHKHDLSDILEGATRGKIQCGWGHGLSYWKDATSLPIEAFAEFFSAHMSCKESLETLRKYLPKSSKVFEEMLEELL